MAKLYRYGAKSKRWLAPLALTLAGCSSGSGSGSAGGQGSGPNGNSPSNFSDPGPGAGAGVHPNPVSVVLDFTLRNESSIARTETICASVPFPYGGYSQLGSLQIGSRPTAWNVLQRWADGTVRVAQAQFTATVPAASLSSYVVAAGAATAGAFVRHPWVAAGSAALQIGAEVRDTFGVAYRAYADGTPETVQETAFVRVQRFHRYHMPVSAQGIGRDYLTSTFYLTEYSSMPYVLVDWVVGNDYQGVDAVPAQNTNPNLRPLGMIDVTDARFLTRGATGLWPYNQLPSGIGNIQAQSDGFAAFSVLQNSYLEDAQTHRYRFLAYCEDATAPQVTRDGWRATAIEMLERPLRPLATQRTWQETSGAGLLGGPIAGPADANARAEGEYQYWLNNNWFGAWGSRGDAKVTGTTGTPRNHPLSPELAHAIQGGHHRSLHMLEQMAWAQAMRPYHLWALTVSDEQNLLLWDGVPKYPGSRDLSIESLGRRALWAADPYAAYRTLTQTGGARAHGWEHFDNEHWSEDLLFDYWTVTGDAWAREELRQLGQSLKGLMRVRTFATAYIQSVRAEGWTMQGFAQSYLATGDTALRDYAMRRVREVVDMQRGKTTPSKALSFQTNYPGTGWPMNHQFYMPWQHGALIYGYLGAYRHFRDPLLLQICEESVACVDYAWVCNFQDPHYGLVADGLRYYVITQYAEQPVAPTYFDGTVPLHWGDAPLGGAHTFLTGGMFLLADWSANANIRAHSIYYAQRLQPAITENLRWNKWNYCVPARFSQ
ncbi:MAG: hypothetical protein WCR59_01225 [Planctomycetota bacterium]|nr:hypothetical protein [Planctomycetota bacterium]